MIAVPINPHYFWILELKRFLFMWVAPFLVGWVLAIVYPVGMRYGMQHAAKPFWKVAPVAGLGPTLMLIGWSFILRTMWTCIPYGLGYGMGAWLLGRVHSVRLWPPAIVSRKKAAALLRLAAE